MNTLEFDANHLKYVRQILNASQDSLAKRLKITRQTVNRFETGEQKISDKFLDKLLVTYPDLAESIEVQFDWVSLTFPDLTSKQVMNVKLLDFVSN
nr:helix-turn-helix transcriptional regulator [Leuconostoc lactis]